METVLTLFATLGAVIWLIILVLPYRPWSTREALDGVSNFPQEDLSDITVLVPARNEEEMIKTTLPALLGQGRGLHIILVDDQSTDGTFEIARQIGGKELLIILGEAPPAGWSGKLWALEQGRSHIETPLTLLLDADIEVKPGIIMELRRAMKERNVQLISLMAMLRMKTFWERLLMPAFVYFFKLLYPFRLSNSPGSKTAAAAGGCILMETAVLNAIGAFASLRGELIDDCALARRVKSLGYKTWMGLSHSVRSLRPYNSLGIIWNMVARTAFTQLGYSKLALLFCTIIMLVSFCIPVIGLLLSPGYVMLLSAFCLAGMMLTYLPTLRFYGIAGWWALPMPLIGSLYLAMTWTSAIKHWLGETAHWKGRKYR
ncbi:MAG: glycosyltransferase [Deltaproteobacteria bacterium]|nr:glycosyltransferase [Deltaproteobacteria bacterium]